MMRVLVLVLLIPGLSGCGYLFGDDGFFRDSTGDYRQAGEEPLLSLPEGQSGEKLTEIYAIPAIEDDVSLSRSDRIPRPAPLVAASANQLVRIQKLGDDTWALIAIAPGQLWPQLRSFLSAASVSVARMDARAGIIESDYLDLEGQDQASRFRFRVERGVQRGNSELHILQMYQRSEDIWPPNSDDPELEAELLRGVAQFIANSADTAPVSMMAEQSISASGKVSIEEDEGGGELIRLDLPFDRAWASLARALDLSKFEITDRNRSSGTYYVQYLGADDEEESGWFDWLGGSDDGHPATGIPLIITVIEAQTERVEIRLAPEAAGDLEAEDLQSLLLLIKGNIN